MGEPDALSQREPAGSRPWLADALRPDVVRRSLRVAALVGAILVGINYTDRWLAGSLTRADWLKMGVTFLVPYAVATYAAVDAIRGRGSQRA
jgi:uncharacterized membrane protein